MGVYSQGAPFVGTPKLSCPLCFLVIYQDERKLERHWRAKAGDPWEYDILLEALNSRITIPGLDFELTFDDVYEGVSFDAEG